MTTEDLFASWRGARVRVRFDDGFAFVAIAVFVYEVPGGFVYVGPGYRDEWGADRASHLIEGALTVAADGSRVDFVGPKLSGDLSPIDEEEGGAAGAVVYELDEALRGAGVTWAGERERLRPSP